MVHQARWARRSVVIFPRTGLKRGHGKYGAWGLSMILVLNFVLV